MYVTSTEQGSRQRVQALAEQLHREHYPFLLRIAVRNAANHADAEEVVQDAFVSLIDHFAPTGRAPPLAG